MTDIGALLKQAQDAKILDITKTPAGYELVLRPGMNVDATIFTR